MLNYTRVFVALKHSLKELLSDCKSGFVCSAKASMRHICKAATGCDAGNVLRVN